MMNFVDLPDPSLHELSVQNYYRFHSRIYDLTRWSFLFGREQMIRMIPTLPAQPRIMEVGCGTGKNLKRLAYHFPEAQLTGVDLSSEMLKIAEKKLESSGNIRLIEASYGNNSLNTEPCDLILLSYSLTMFGNPIEAILDHLCDNLKANGYIAVVDFDRSPFGWFRQWMAMNHVDLSGHTLPMLKKYFLPVKIETNSAYLGLWSYFLFLGACRT